MSNTSCATYFDNAVIAIANIVLIQSAPYIRPNITGKYWFMTCRDGIYEGALVKGETHGDSYNGANNRGNYSGVNLDASVGNSTFGKTTIIQPNSAYSFMIIKE